MAPAGFRANSRRCLKGFDRRESLTVLWLELLEKMSLLPGIYRLR